MLSVVIFCLFATLGSSVPRYGFSYAPTFSVSPTVEQATNVPPQYTGATLLPGSRAHHQMTADLQRSGLVWLFGGERVTESGSWTQLGDLWLYNVSGSTWELRSLFAIQRSGSDFPGQIDPVSLPGARASHCMGSLEDGSTRVRLFGGGGYAVGGDMYAYLQDVWDYNPEGVGAWRFRSVGKNSYTWADVPDRKIGSVSTVVRPSGRYGASAWILGADTYVYGGWSREGIADGTMWRFADSSATWERIMSTDEDEESLLRKSTLYQTNWKVGKRVDDAVFYAFGGGRDESHTSNGLYRFVVRHAVWERAGRPYPKQATEANPGGRLAAPAVLVEDRTFAARGPFAVVLGGFGHPLRLEGGKMGNLADVWRVNLYDSAAETFEHLPVTESKGELVAGSKGSFDPDKDPHWSGRMGAAAVLVDRTIVLYGGIVSEKSYAADLWTLELPCSRGATGDQCGVFTCADGELMGSRYSCSGHGSCEYPGGECVCADGYFGERCELAGIGVEYCLGRFCSPFPPAYLIAFVLGLAGSFVSLVSVLCGPCRRKKPSSSLPEVDVSEGAGAAEFQMREVVGDEIVGGRIFHVVNAKGFRGIAIDGIGCLDVLDIKMITADSTLMHFVIETGLLAGRNALVLSVCSPHEYARLTDALRDIGAFDV